jgi:predicted ArsR family transcriptional regulator
MEWMEAMQPTRKRILEMLRDCQTCTADSLAEALEIKEVRYRERPGRPQHAWSLTPCALERFPKNYQSLSLLMLDEIKESLSAEDMQRISRGVASRMAAQAHIPTNAKPEQRLKAAVNYLNECGYAAEWERHGKKFLLRTKN